MSKRLFDLIQNITGFAGSKADDCDAVPKTVWRNQSVGMNVARFTRGFWQLDLPGATAHGSVQKEIWIMLWTILVILLVLWLIGLLSNVGGSLIHLLLVVAVVVLIINLVTGRRAV